MLSVHISLFYVPPCKYFAAVCRFVKIIIMMIVIVIVILGDDSDGALQLERVSSASAALERCLVT